jgi:hypothetical protein
MITVLGRDLGRDARVVTVAFDQARGALPLHDATLRLVRASVLGILRHADLELRPLELQRFGLVVAN